MERCHPHGHTIATLKAGVFKLRALEMVLMLFYVESLKGFIISSVGITERLRKILDNTNPKTDDGEQISFKKAHELLILEGVMIQEESVQLKGMIDYRNAISREIHKITVDIGAHLDLTKYDLPDGHKISRYDYSAVQRIQKFRKNIERKMIEESFCFELSFNTLAFDAAEQTYLKEIRRLRKKASTEIDRLSITIKTTNKIIRNIPREVMDTIQPGHPKNRKSNGALSAEGVRGMLMLYDTKTTPLATSCIVRVSYRTASKWYKGWIRKQTEK